MNHVSPLVGWLRREHARASRGAFCVAMVLASLNASAALSGYTTSWLGSSSSNPNNYVGSQPLSIAADPAGRFVVLGQDERGMQGVVYNGVDGSIAGHLSNLRGYDRWGVMGLAVNSNYIYVTLTQGGCDGANTNLNANHLPNYPVCGTVWHCVARYRRSDLQPSTFSTGYGFSSSYLQVQSLPKTTGIPDARQFMTNQVLRGLAASQTELFVCDWQDAKIKVYNAATMAFLRDWAVDRPVAVALDQAGMAWVLQAAATNSPARVLRFSPAGVPQPETITFATGVDPVQLAADPPRHRLLVSDGGEEQNIKIYDLSPFAGGNPTAVSTNFGVPRGIFGGAPSEAGTVGPLRFDGIHGLTVDASGNLCVGTMGLSRPLPQGLNWSLGATIAKYAPDGTQLWKAVGLEYIDCADTDPASENEVYTGNEHYRMDYAQAPGREATHVGHTINLFQYPSDVRLFNNLNNGLPWVRRIQGAKFLFLTGMYADWIAIYRFHAATDGEVAIPCGLYCYNNAAAGAQPGRPSSNVRYLWVDANGNGQPDAGECEFDTSAYHHWGLWVDDNANLWLGYENTRGIVRVNFGGLNAQGVPQYSFTNTTAFALPSDLNKLERLQYLPETDTMYLSGYSASYPEPSGSWGLAGSVLLRYDGWTNGQRTVHPGYPINLPTNSAGLYPEGFAVSGRPGTGGEYLFLPYYNKQANMQMRVYDAQAGTFLDFMATGAEVGSFSADVDTRNCVRAVRRANGQHLIFVEADQVNRVTMFRWWPGGVPKTIRLQPPYQCPTGTNGFSMTVSANPQAGYVLLVSTNLADWVPLQTNTAAAAQFVVADTNAPAFPQRYYRLIVPP